MIGVTKLGEGLDSGCDRLQRGSFDRLVGRAYNQPLHSFQTAEGQAVFPEGLDYGTIRLEAMQ